MHVQMLRHNWTFRSVVLNATIAGFVGLAAVRVAQAVGVDTELASAFGGTIGYMGAMTTEFVTMCIKEHYNRRQKQKLNGC